MRDFLVPRALSLALPIMAVLALVRPPYATANEVAVGGAAHGLVIHDAPETLRDYCQRDADGVLWMVLPGGARFELVTSVDDPAITNHGDGQFHPFDAAEVRHALNGVRFPLERVHADVFLLPYPRRYGLDSAAGSELILLSPGVRPILRSQQHAELVHELGHVVQYALMPDGQANGWDAYRKLRGILDEDVYAASSAHANRPHEIFAEDFRALFGGPEAVASGSIENGTIAAPASVRGLDRFLFSLSGVTMPALQLTASANPARGRLFFAQIGGAPAPLDLFDVSGRRVASLEPVVTPGAIEWHWDGSEASGRRLGAGVVFARVRGVPGRATRVTVLP